LSRQPTTLEFILKKDRAILAGCLIGISVISWLYIIYLYKQMYPMNMKAFLFAMPMTAAWSLTDFLLLFLMWFVMMVAMMTASVAPLILIFAMVNRQKQQQQNPYVPAGYLFAGYYFTWGVFSLLATLLQWALQQFNWLNPDMIITHKILGAVILIAAGIFQFTSLKQRCLAHCQTPVDFIHKKWKAGKSGAFKMGMENGIYCLGCCWILMVVLFVAGVMNLLWIALIAIFVLLEKLVPQNKWISFIAGAGLIGYGICILFI
jgi:predicted metal-binding membrane protein